jgi:hypothetical protein
MATAGGVAGHFHKNIPKTKVREMADVLELGESGLVIAAVDKKGSDIEPLLAHATKSVIDDTTHADLDGLYDDAIKQVAA